MATKAGKRGIKVMVLGSIVVLLLVLTACRPGNQVTGSSAFVENPEKLPLGKAGNVSSVPRSAPVSPEKQANWITGVVG